MHNLFRNIDENIHRRRSKRSRPRSESLSNIETLEQRIALTANVYTTNNTGDSPGYVTIMLDESGDDLYLRQTIDDFSVGFDPIARLQYADNPEFSLSQSQNFSTNSVTRPLNEYQDVFVGQGVANTHSDLLVGGLSPTTVLPDANFFDGVARTLPTGLTADEAFHILPGTLQGNNDFGGSFIAITNGNGVIESMSVATLNLLDEQDLTVNGDIPLVFSQTGGSSGTTSITLGFGGDENVTVTGEVNLFTGRVSLDLDPATNPPADAPYSTSFFFDYGSPVIAAEPSTFTLASGFTLDAGLIVDLPSVDSTIAINSPVAIPTRDAGDIGLVDLRATNVLVNAPMAADQGFRVLQSRFLNEASVEASPVSDAVTSQCGDNRYSGDSSRSWRASTDAERRGDSTRYECYRSERSWSEYRTDFIQFSISITISQLVLLQPKFQSDCRRHACCSD